MLNPYRNGGAVGAAATEADAVREACVAIEEMSASVGGDAPSLRLNTNRSFDSVIARQACSESWSGRLDCVSEYLARV